MRIEKLPDQTEVTDADRGLDRLNAWKGTWELFKEFPVFGSGFGAFKNGITRHLEYSGQMRWEQAHNDYLEYLAAGGLVGLGLGIWFLFAVIRRAVENLRIDRRGVRMLRFAAITGIVGIAVHSIVDFGLHTMVNSMVLMTLLSVLTTKSDRSRSLQGKKVSIAEQ
jgi:putative inorganic carbon (hco3(-)) transporter